MPRIAIWLFLLGFLSGPLSAQGENPPEILPEIGQAAQLPLEARQFDFWVGEWEVLLRTQQKDGRWEDSTTATARIYSVLKRKAVLELWDSEEIKGVSLRYFDPSRGKWVLWLNWPGQDRSGGSGMEGSFHHGRAEFFSIKSNVKGEEVITRYTFSDISSRSLRWDDAFSKDGGKTWSNQWIMEFSRTGRRPELPEKGGPLPTFHSGDQCRLDPFRRFEVLVGHRWGKVQLPGPDGSWIDREADLTGYEILDGCAVLAMISYDLHGISNQSLHLLTWNTSMKMFEETWLDSRPSGTMEVYHGIGEGDDIGLRRSGELGAEPDSREHLWHLDGDYLSLELRESDEPEGDWRRVQGAQFPRDPIGPSFPSKRD